VAEARAFVAGKPYLDRVEAARTLATFTRW
jgi:hypothetical protein